MRTQKTRRALSNGRIDMEILGYATAGLCVVLLAVNCYLLTRM